MFVVKRIKMQNMCSKCKLKKTPSRLRVGSTETSGRVYSALSDR